MAWTSPLLGSLRSEDAKALQQILTSLTAELKRLQAQLDSLDARLVAGGL